MTCDEKQAILNAEYAVALIKARAHIAAGTDYSPDEWAAEVARARHAGLPENANWLHRTPSPLSLQQVAANDDLDARVMP
jgi:hypothetical protein